MKELTGETLEQLSYLAALGWTDADIAGFLDLPEQEFGRAMAGMAPEFVDIVDAGRIRQAVTHGRLEKRAEIEIAVAVSAAGGNAKAVRQYSEIVRDRSFSISKLDLFGGADREGAFERIQEYIASGSKGILPEKEQVYVDLLTLVYSLDGQYGKRRTIRFLTSKPFEIPYDRASDIYSEAVELFFANRKVSKDALRNKIADQFDSLYIAARDSAKTTRDYEVASGILANKARALQLDRDDPQRLPPEVYQRPYRVLGLTPEVIGLPPANREELARQIDGLVAPDQVRRRLRRDAGVDDLDIVQYLEDAKEEG